MFAMHFSDLKIRQSMIFKPNIESKSLDRAVYFDFVDRYIIRSMRHPQSHMPTVLIDANMQSSLETSL